jgi:crossover junction endodeoxyribonuclease RuvC
VRPAGEALARRVVGIDPGLASTGWGMVDVERRRCVYRAHGCIETPAGMSLARRLDMLERELAAVLEEWSPDTGAMESLFFSRNVTSALNVAEAKGVVRLCCLRHRIELAEYRPIALKQAIAGSGSADKADVQGFIKIILKLKEIPKPDHAADALGAAICHIHTTGMA